MLDQNSNEGYWILHCDSDPSATPTEIRMVSEKLRKLPQKFPELFPIPPVTAKFKPKFDNLLVFTSAVSDEECEKSAEAIRRIVDFPFLMPYFKRNVIDRKANILLYQHTPGGELYKTSEKRNSAGSKLKLVGKKAELTAIFDELLPSQVVDRDHIHLPVTEKDFKKATSEKGGKWILHCSDWETLDDLWKKLIRLYITGIIVGLKSCTAKFSITNIFQEYKTKAIMCYTSDAECRLSVKRAAQSIFICTGYDYVMYYKSNEASLAGKYQHEGFKKISKYMYTSGGEMLERDHLDRWKTINFDEEKHK